MYGACADVVLDIVVGLSVFVLFFFFLMIRRPPRSTPLYSSAASDVYKRQMIYSLRLRTMAPIIII